MFAARTVGLGFRALVLGTSSNTKGAHLQTNPNQPGSLGIGLSKLVPKP